MQKADAAESCAIRLRCRQEVPSLQSTVADAITNTVGRLGEKLALRRAASLHVPGGLVSAYVHGAAAAAPTTADGPAVGRVGVLVGARAPPTSGPFLRQVRLPAPAKVVAPVH